MTSWKVLRELKENVELLNIVQFNRAVTKKSLIKLTKDELNCLKEAVIVLKRYKKSYKTDY